MAIGLRENVRRDQPKIFRRFAAQDQFDYVIFQAIAKKNHSLIDSATPPKEKLLI